MLLGRLRHVISQSVSRYWAIWFVLLSCWLRILCCFQILPRGVSGDVYDLASTMFQLSTVGPTMKTIIFKYIKHSLCSGVGEHNALHFLV